MSLLLETKGYPRTMENENYSRLKAQIAELLKHDVSGADLLRMITSDPEKTKSKFYKFLKGKSVPSGDVLVEWITKIGFTITPPDEKLKGFSLVRMVKAEAGAGESFLTSGRVIGQYAFRDSFMERERLHADKCVLMRVRGDSMMPLINEGDTILVDESEMGKKLQDGQIHVVGLDDALMVKRMAKIPGGWRLCSENKERGNVDVIEESLDSLRVYGRVRWFGRVV